MFSDVPALSSSTAHEAAQFAGETRAEPAQYNWEQAENQPSYSWIQRAQDITSLVVSTIFFPVRLIANACGKLVFPAQFNPAQFNPDPYLFYEGSFPLKKETYENGKPFLTPVQIQTKDQVRINAYDIRNEKAPEDPSKQKWIVYCNPNATSAEALIRECKVPENVFDQTNCNLLMFNYRGTYSDDSASRQPAPLFSRELIYDGEAAVEYLLSQGVPEENILIQGHSLGGGVATHVKASYPKAALLNDRSFRSVSWAATKMFGLDTQPEDSLGATICKTALSYIIGGALWLSGWQLSAEHLLPSLEGRIALTYTDSDQIIREEANLAHAPNARPVERYEIGGFHGRSIMDTAVGRGLYPFLVLSLLAKEGEGYTEELHQAFYRLNLATGTDISHEVMQEYNRLKGTDFDVHSEHSSWAASAGDSSMDYKTLLQILHRRLKALEANEE